MPHPIDALISDCDGVLVDSEVIAERVMYEALSAYAPLEELQRLLEGTFGLTSRDILDRVEKHFGLRIPDSFNREVRQRSERWSPRSNPFPAHARRCWPWTCPSRWPPTAAATAWSARWRAPGSAN